VESKTEHENDTEQTSWSSMYILAVVGLIVACGVLWLVFRIGDSEGGHEMRPPPHEHAASPPVQETAAAEPEPDAVEKPPAEEPAEELAEQAYPVPESITTQGVPAVPLDLGEKLESWLNRRRVQVCGPHPDGGLLVLADTGEGLQIHHVATAGAGAEPLTSGPHAPGCAVTSPDPDAGFFLFTREGRILRQGLDGGEPVVVAGEGRNADVVFDDAGTQIAYASDRRAQDRTVVRVMDPSDPSTDRVVLEAPSDARYVPASWMPNGRHLMVHEVASAQDVRSLLVDTVEGTFREVDLDETRPCVTMLGPAAPLKGSTLGVSDCVRGDHVHLVTVDMSTRYGKPLTRDIPWDVTSFVYSPASSILAFVANEGGVGRLYAMLWEDERWIRKGFDVLPAGRVESMAFGPEGTRLAVALSTVGSPGRVYELDLMGGGIEIWWDPTGPTGPEQVVSLVDYPTFDEVDEEPRSIPALVVEPAGRPEQPLPVVVVLHDDPVDQWTAGWEPFASPLAAYLTSTLGVAVVAPNVRGSSGYGRSFTLLDDRQKRWDAVRDVGALLDWIDERPDLDAGRVVLVGRSYGGYLALGAMTEHPDRLRGGVVISAIADLASFVENAPEGDAERVRREYGEEHETLVELSPIARVSRITCPVLVAHGEGDPRVPVADARRIVDALADGGVPHWSLTAADEGHLDDRPEHRAYLAAAIVLFVRQMLDLEPDPA
jgi:dienelactone hydrolase